MNFLEFLFLRFYCLDFSAICLILGTATALYLLLRSFFEKKSLFKAVTVFGFVSWCAVIAAATVVSRECGVIEPSLVPFSSYMEVLGGGNVEIIRSNIMNIILFYPAGLLLCDSLPRRMKRGIRVLISFCVGVASSACIEFLQYFFALGRAEFDDVMHNGLGMLIGALASLICVFEWIFKKTKKENMEPFELKKEEKILLLALKDAISEEKGEFPLWEMTPEDWNRLFELCAQQKLHPLVFDRVCNEATLKSSPDYLKHKMSAISQVTVQAIKTKELFELYERLSTAGLHPLVVKGVICRGLYEKGDHRPSTDEDILIPETELEAAVEVMKDFGMVCGEYSPESSEIGFRKKGSPLYVELHKSLFPPESGAYGDLNEYFEGCFDRAEEYTVESGRVIASLSAQNHLFYLILHAYKHFIHSGFGIRQAADIGLFAKRYEKRIDFSRLHESCRKAGVSGFAAGVFGLCEKYLSIDCNMAKTWESGTVSPEPMLRDLLSAGVYGSSDKSRQHSATVTLSAVEADKKGKAQGGLLRSLFPSAAQMSARFGVLRKHPWLLPVFWVVRLCGYVKETAGKGESNSAAESVRIAKERTQLLKFYGIIK